MTKSRLGYSISGMCYKIEPSFVLIHVLKTKETCGISEMISIKRKVEKKLPAVYLDVSKNSILATVSSYPEIFSWRNGTIERKANTDDFFQGGVMNFFNNTNMNKKLESRLIQCIESNE